MCVKMLYSVCHSKNILEEYIIINICRNEASRLCLPFSTFQKVISTSLQMSYFSLGIICSCHTKAIMSPSTGHSGLAQLFVFTHTFPTIWNVALLHLSEAFHNTPTTVVICPYGFPLTDSYHFLCCISAFCSLFSHCHVLH